MMNLNKFGYYGSMRTDISEHHAKTVHWIPDMNVTHRPQKINPSTWKIFSQEKITIKPNEIKTIALGFGFRMSSGMILTSLTHATKLKKLILLNSFEFEDCEDIIVSIQNYGHKTQVISEAEAICLVHYSK